MTPDLPRRVGTRPRTHQGMPHRQLDQQPAVDAIGSRLAERVLTLAGVTEAPSAISVPGARAFLLKDSRQGPPGAFLVGREFAHLHPAPDHSLHLTLPEWRARAVIAAGWGELHPLVATGALPPTVVMIYAPRDQKELEVVYGLVQESYHFALDPTPSIEGAWPTSDAADDERRTPMAD